MTHFEITMLILVGLASWVSYKRGTKHGIVQTFLYLEENGYISEKDMQKIYNTKVIK